MDVEPEDTQPVPPPSGLDQELDDAMKTVDPAQVLKDIQAKKEDKKG